jgi:hypothetical protein
MYQGFDDYRGRGEGPVRKVFIKSSKGCPAQRDPQAENPRGVLPSKAENGRELGEASLYKYRQRYSL